MESQNHVWRLRNGRGFGAIGHIFAPSVENIFSKTVGEGLLTARS